METIVIIGAGASGLACMNELVKTNKYNIIVLEQSNKAARKIRVFDSYVTSIRI